MLTFIIAIFLMLLALVALILRKTYFYLPVIELKRQARAGDGLAKVLYRAVAYGSSLRLLLWLIIGLSAAIGLELFVRSAPVGWGIVVVALLLWLGFAWMPSTRLTTYAARLAVWCTPAVAWLLGAANPIFSRLTIWWHKHFPALEHSGLYERIDLAELIKRQKDQPDNRIEAEILDLMSQALHFDEYRVRDVLVPRRAVVSVDAKATVGPILLDELHATGHTRFPVHGKSPDDIVGTLQLMTLDEARDGGKASDYMDKSLVFLHEADPLPEALQVVYATRQSLFLVVNSFEEYVGIVTLSDILQRLTGPKKSLEFNEHRDARAVAAKHPGKKKPPAKEEKSDKND